MKHPNIVRPAMGYLGLWLQIFRPVHVLEDPWGVPISVIERHKEKIQARMDR